MPSLDTQTNYLEPVTAKEIIELFLDDFPLSKIAHFGPNLSSILIENRKSSSFWNRFLWFLKFAVLASIQRRVPRIFLSVFVDDKNIAAVSTILPLLLKSLVQLSSVPSYVTLCVEGSFPFDIEKKISPRVSLVLKFSSGEKFNFFRRIHDFFQEMMAICVLLLSLQPRKRCLHPNSATGLKFWVKIYSIYFSLSFVKLKVRTAIKFSIYSSKKE